MHQHNILKSDETLTRFLRLCTEMCVDLCYRALQEPTSNTTLSRQRCFHTLDAYVRLIALMVKHSGEAQYTIKMNLVNKVTHSTPNGVEKQFNSFEFLGAKYTRSCTYYRSLRDSSSRIPSVALSPDHHNVIS